MKKYVLKALMIFTAIMLACLIGILLLFRASLPLHTGHLSLDRLKQQVIIDRDQLGIPTIQASHREDIAQALGFLHAQERFFQMDLLRRASSGELAELVGRVALEFDKKRRYHALRRVAKQMWSQLTHEEQEILQAYSHGVNQGLSHLQAKPFEYFLLFTSPQPWKPEDSLLVGLNLFFELQDAEGEKDLMKGYLHRLLPSSVSHFFLHQGSPWDAPLDGSKIPYVPIPPPEDFSYLNSFDVHSMEEIPIQADAPHLGGSNHWAVSGKKTKDGKAILACDMHLGLSVPTIWYRARFLNLNSHKVDICGLTLPGMPLMICGSNGQIAWGFTNAYLDTADIAMVTLHPENQENYLTVEGWKPLIKRKEVIFIKGESPDIIEFSDTEWGPLLANHFFDQPIALKWIAHDPECLNLKLMELENASSVEEALAKIPQIKMPILNCLLADREGNIGWTLVGTLPERQGFDGTLPILLQDPSCQWLGKMDPSSYPKIVNPKDGILWTANNRTLDIAKNPLMSSSYFINGIRAYQIQRRLNETSNFTLQKMLSIQLDDEAFFFQRWHQLFMQTLQKTPFLEGKRKELLEVISTWEGHASAQSAAYYWIRSFRAQVYQQVLKRILKPCFLAYPSFHASHFDFEEPVWLIASQQPDYLANPKYGSWQKELLSFIDEMIEKTPPGKIKEQTWGKRNTMAISHPLSGAIPGADVFLNMKPDSISGDYWVPRVISSTEGASQRLVVAPGNEKEGILQMPCGQSGHPLSPHYRDQHQDWVEGRATSLLSGPTQQTLILMNQ